MKTRLANHTDMESIYQMGSDVWGCDVSEQQYLEECRSSKKYQLGEWYCLEQKSALVSSLIVYKNDFGLSNSYAGFGSIATTPAERNKGYASTLVKACIKKLSDENYRGVYLFNDAGSKIYESCGFELVSDKQAMMFLSINSGSHEVSPEYF